jgi:hypothetical protein
VIDNPIRHIDPDGMEQASAEAMASYTNGTLGDGTGTNTVVYSAGDNTPVPQVQTAPTMNPNASSPNQPIGSWSDPETIVITYHNGVDFVTSTIVTHYLEDNKDGTQTDNTVTTTTTAAIDPKGNIAKQVTQTILMSSQRQSRANEDMPTIDIGDVKQEKPIKNNLPFLPGKDLNNIVARVSEFKQNYHISPLVEIATFNLKRTSFDQNFGTVTEVVGVVTLAIANLYPKSWIARPANILGGAMTIDGLLIDMHARLLGTDPEKMQFQVK